jgi:radical SAM superfamily enzyme YgiQ (UPF0313 family)
MSGSQPVLLVNPTITSQRNARFPLAILNLSAAIEAHHDCTLIDGNVDRDFIATTVRAAVSAKAVGITVMGGPQLRSAIELSKAIRRAAPKVPIIWGGAFPTVCPRAALNAPYVDFVVRGQGESTFLELLSALPMSADSTYYSIRGLSWRHRDQAVHNEDRKFSAHGLDRTLPYAKLANPRRYLVRTYLGTRTAAYQAGLGCRFRCTFCGVATMFKGRMALPAAAKLEQDLAFLKASYGLNAIQFYDHNFFDREVDMVPLLRVLAKLELPWWCYARSDALVNMSASSWALVRKSGLRMAYIGAESPSDWLLHDVRKGTHSDQTLQAIEQCRRHDVIPELSFMVAPPQDPEGETERTFEFIRAIKRVHPATEVMIYVYTPLPRRESGTGGPERLTSEYLDRDGGPIRYPDSAEGWAEPAWIDYWCHQGAPWLSPQLRRRIVDFTTVLGCRFPTIMDIRAPEWGKSALRALASWRYRFQRYDDPWELKLSRKLIRQWDPRVMSL